MECIELTTGELNELLAQGWTVQGGPYDTEEDCRANCGSSSSSSSSSSQSQSSSQSSSGSKSGSQSQSNSQSQSGSHSQPSILSGIGCCDCGASPYQWSLSVSGFGGTDAFGSDCASLNGTWTLTYWGSCASIAGIYPGNFCVYSTDPDITCSGSGNAPPGNVSPPCWLLMVPIPGPSDLLVQLQGFPSGASPQEAIVYSSPNQGSCNASTGQCATWFCLASNTLYNCAGACDSVGGYTNTAPYSLTIVPV